MDKAKSRTSTRDQAIRKRYSHSSSFRSTKLDTPPRLKSFDAASGTVMSMGPVLPVKADSNATITEIARLMAGRRADAVLIESDADGLLGIVTDKDLAYRVVAEGLDASKVKVHTIMTPKPVFVRSNASVDEAMNKMLNGHFRHLPVVEDNKVVALVDINKVMHHIQVKIKNSWGKAEALQLAFQDFKNSWQNFHAAPEVEQWFNDWSSRMVEPDLSHAMMEQLLPVPVVNMKSSVLEASRKMKETRQTACLVYDNKNMVGIFTTKDIVLRVLAPNESDPNTMTVLRVMTPSPECASDKMTVNDALKKMHDGHYLHLPVYSGDRSNVIGLVDVLTLTYQTMESLIRQQQMNPLTPITKSETTDGTAPMWDKFWANNDDGGLGMESDDNSSTITAQRRGRGMTIGSEIDGSPAPKGGLVGAASSVNGSVITGTHTAINWSNNFVFKFRDPFTGMIHKFSHRIDTEDGRSPFITLLESILGKIGFEVCLKDLNDVENRNEKILEHYNKFQCITAKKVENHDANETFHFRIFYHDDEKDSVLIANDGNLLDAVDIAKALGWTRLSLTVECVLERDGKRIPITLNDDVSRFSWTPEANDKNAQHLSPEFKVFQQATFWIALVGSVSLAVIVSAKIFGK